MPLPQPGPRSLRRVGRLSHLGSVSRDGRQGQARTSGPRFRPGFSTFHRITGLDHGVGHFRPLSITRQRHLLVYHYIAMSHEGLCQVF